VTKVNAHIRQEVRAFCSTVPDNTILTLDEIKSVIQKKMPKALVSNRRVGIALREQEDILRLGQRGMNQIVYYQKIAVRDSRKMVGGEA